MYACICVSVCHICVGQKVPTEARDMGPMELELQVVVSHPIGIRGIQASLLCKSESCSEPPGSLIFNMVPTRRGDIAGG